MKPLLLPLPGGECTAARLQHACLAELGTLEIHRFPDAEVRVRLLDEVAGRTVILVGPLDHPDEKLLPLLFAAATARERGAAAVGLVAPYLSYLRQDAEFMTGEAVSGRHFLRLLSGAADWLVTVDPHLHRIPDLRGVFAGRCDVVHAAPLIADWVQRHTRFPLVIGPDAESEQWVEAVAADLGAPCRILAKRRRGDRVVELTLPPMPEAKAWQPVLLDDMVSTGGTVLAAARLLEAAGFPPPLVVAVHAVLGADVSESLAEARLELVTCNTIDHPSNRIDVTPLLRDAIGRQVALDAGRSSLVSAGDRPRFGPVREAVT